MTFSIGLLGLALSIGLQPDVPAHFEIEGTTLRTEWVEVSLPATAPTPSPTSTSHESAHGSHDGTTDDPAFPALHDVLAASAPALTLSAAVQEGGWTELPDRLVHGPSGMQCPKRGIPQPQGEGQDPIPVYLAGITIHDKKGLDTSCNYLSADKSYLLTIYASNWPDVDIETHFLSALYSIDQSLPIKERVPVLIAELERTDGKKTAVETDTIGIGFNTEPIKGKAFQTILWLNKVGDWHVKARATYTPPEVTRQIPAMLMHTLAIIQIDDKVIGAAPMEAVSFTTGSALPVTQP